MDYGFIGYRNSEEIEANLGSYFTISLVSTLISA